MIEWLGVTLKWARTDAEVQRLGKKTPCDTRIKISVCPALKIVFSFAFNQIIIRRSQQHNHSSVTRRRTIVEQVEMAYTDDAVKAKLSALNETQESIVTVAQWVMFHRYGNFSVIKLSLNPLY